MINQIKKFIRRIKIRRGVESQRTSVIFDQGEPVYIRDKKRLYIGDSVTYGGIVQTHITFIQNNNTIPAEALPNEIIYNKIDKEGFIINRNKELINIFNNTVSLQSEIESDINTIHTYLHRLSTECCNDGLMLKDDTEQNILTDSGNRIKVREYE